MKLIGLLGGMSWESTQLYYQLINRAVQAKLGGVHSARCIVFSFDFAEIEAMQATGDWASAGRALGTAGRTLREAGCDFLVLCTNTMHVVADEIEQLSGLELLHIGDVTAEALHAAGHTTVALLGTRYTMEQPFLRERLERRGLRILVPKPHERELIHDVIYGELVRGTARDASRRTYLEIIERLRAQGAEAAVLGCTEIRMLIKNGDASIPLFDTTELHALSAVQKAYS